MAGVLSRSAHELSCRQFLAVPHQHAVFTVERLKALAALLSSEGVGYAVTNLDGNAASALFEIFEFGLAEVQDALAEMAHNEVWYVAAIGLKTDEVHSWTRWTTAFGVLSAHQSPFKINALRDSQTAKPRLIKVNQSYPSSPKL